MSNYSKVVEIIERFYIYPMTVRQYEKKTGIKYNIYSFINDFLEYINPNYRVEKYIRAKPEDFDCIQVIDRNGNFVDLIHFPMTYLYVSLNIDKNFKENKHYIIEKCQSDMPGLLDLCDIDIAYGLNKDYHKKLLTDLTMYTERYRAEFDKMYSDFSRSIPIYYVGKANETYKGIYYKKKKIFTSIPELISYYGKDGVDSHIYIYSRYVKL